MKCSSPARMSGTQVLAASKSVRRCLKRLSWTGDGSFISFYLTSATDEADPPPHSGTRAGGRAVLRCCKLNRTRPARHFPGPIPSAGNAPPTERRIARDHRLLWLDCAEFFNNLEPTV